MVLVNEMKIRRDMPLEIFPENIWIYNKIFWNNKTYCYAAVNFSPISTYFAFHSL
jgi:hypothetical protein